MATPNDVKLFLSKAADAVNRSEQARSIVREACRHYPGKIFQFNVDGSKFHLIFFADGHVELRDGEYPSADVHYISDPYTFLGVLKGEKQLRDVTADWSFIIEGAMHETTYLAKAITTAFKK